jgi:hypothetical protein
MSDRPRRRPTAAATLRPPVNTTGRRTHEVASQDGNLLRMQTFTGASPGRAQAVMPCPHHGKASEWLSAGSVLASGLGRVTTACCVWGVAGWGRGR